MIETKDLALATTLRLEGHEPVRMVLRDREAFWVFGDLAESVVSRYNNGRCQVEPRTYNLKLRQTRDQLFDFLNKRGVYASKPAF